MIPAIIGPPITQNPRLQPFPGFSPNAPYGKPNELGPPLFNSGNGVPPSTMPPQIGYGATDVNNHQHGMPPGGPAMIGAPPNPGPISPPVYNFESSAGMMPNVSASSGGPFQTLNHPQVNSVTHRQNPIPWWHRPGSIPIGRDQYRNFLLKGWR